MNGWSSHRRSAFTLIELIAVMTLVAILAAVAIPSFASVGSTNAGMAARILAADIAFARQRAIATGVRTWVTIDPDAEQWTLASEQPGVPGLADALAIQRPGVGGAWSVNFTDFDLDSADVTAAVFDGAPTVGFDWRGQPLQASGARLAADGVVSLAGGRQILVDVASGVVELR